MEWMRCIFKLISGRKARGGPRIPRAFVRPLVRARAQAQARECVCSTKMKKKAGRPSEPNECAAISARGSGTPGTFHVTGGQLLAAPCASYAAPSTSSLPSRLPAASSDLTSGCKLKSRLSRSRCCAIAEECDAAGARPANGSQLRGWPTRAYLPSTYLCTGLHFAIQGFPCALGAVARVFSHSS